ncbi:MAG: MinD/ParA family protein [Pseudomonadota bacterium]|nr:MinD/ParA family protein [Pseudomonadota bacterium]
MNQDRIRSRSNDLGVSHPSGMTGHNLITVASGKGGVGKTWFSITLSHALARAGRKVLLFDGDLGLANVDIQLGLTPVHDLGEALAGRRTFKDVVTRSADTGVDVVAGRSGSARLADARSEELELIRRGLVAIGQFYDHVVIDLGAGVDRGVRALAANAGPTLVITTDEPTAMTDAYALIKLLHAALPRTDFRVVVNMAENRAEGERTFQKLQAACENFLKVRPKLAGVVRRDPHVPDAIRRQVPLMKRHPITAASEDVEAIARSLMAEKQAAN